MLAMHPEIQQRVFQEIKDAHETQTSYTDAEILAKLDYLEMCIKETMRLFPVAPFLARQNVDDVKLSMSIYRFNMTESFLHVLVYRQLHSSKRDDPDGVVPSFTS